MCQRLQGCDNFDAAAQAGTGASPAIVDLFLQVARQKGQQKLARVLLYIISAGQDSYQNSHYPPLEDV
jgi:hypothetical protein